MTTQRHDDPTISAFLVDGDYADIDAWMLDSGYEEDGGEWYYPADYCDPEVAGHQIDAEGAIAGAIEACGFEDPHAFADDVRSLLHAEGIDRL